MGEGILFNLGAVTAISSSVAILVLRSPLKIVLAVFLNVLGMIILLVALQAPILAMIQFIIMMLLLAGAVQFIRAVGPERLYTKRSLSFAQLTGLLLSVLFGGLVLLHMSSLLPDKTAFGVSPKLFFLNLGSNGITLLSLAGLLLFTVFISMRFLLRGSREDT